MGQGWNDQGWREVTDPRVRPWILSPPGLARTARAPQPALEAHSSGKTEVPRSGSPRRAGRSGLGGLPVLPCATFCQPSPKGHPNLGGPCPGRRPGSLSPMRPGSPQPPTPRRVSATRRRPAQPYLGEESWGPSASCADGPGGSSGQGPTRKRAAPRPPPRAPPPPPPPPSAAPRPRRARPCPPRTRVGANRARCAGCPGDRGGPPRPAWHARAAPGTHPTRLARARPPPLATPPAGARKTQAGHQARVRRRACWGAGRAPPGSWRPPVGRGPETYASPS